MPWHRNAITPDRVGFAVAIILPLLHELYRFRCSKDNPIRAAIRQGSILCEVDIEAPLLGLAAAVQIENNPET
jgi:hypothetical protein